jgi:hypothetical protein
MAARCPIGSFFQEKSVGRSVRRGKWRQLEKRFRFWMPSWPSLPASPQRAKPMMVGHFAMLHGVLVAQIRTDKYGFVLLIGLINTIHRVSVSFNPSRALFFLPRRILLKLLVRYDIRGIMSQESEESERASATEVKIQTAKQKKDIGDTAFKAGEIKDGDDLSSILSFRDDRVAWVLMFCM